MGNYSWKTVLTNLTPIPGKSWPATAVEYIDLVVALSVVKQGMFLCSYTRLHMEEIWFFLSVCAIQQFIDINDTWYGQQNNENNKKYSKHFLPVSQFLPVNPFMQIHLYPFLWYKGMHFPVFLQGERSHMDCTKEGILTSVNVSPD